MLACEIEPVRRSQSQAKATGNIVSGRFAVLTDCLHAILCLWAQAQFSSTQAELTTKQAESRKAAVELQSALQEVAEVRRECPTPPQTCCTCCKCLAD